MAALDSRKGGSTSRMKARSGFQRVQAITGLLLLLSACVAIFLLATDRSLWLLAVSHAVGLIIIVAVDVILGVLSFVSPSRAYVPSLAAALLGFVLQLGDVFTAPQYGQSISNFAAYLFGLWAFDLLLVLQLAVMVVGVLGRSYAMDLSRRRSRRGAELSISRRGFLKSLGGIAGAIGLGVLLSSIKFPTGTSSGNQGKPIANINSLQVGVPVTFDYPAGYPNLLMKKTDGTLLGLSLLCTHVCCVCSYDKASGVIYCPCHGSVFDSNGNVLQGPAAAPLPQVTLDIDGAGNVFPTGVINPGPCNA